jgi:hypothetical protein
VIIFRDRTLIERVELQKPCSQYTYSYIRFLQLAGHFMVPFLTSGHLMVLPKSDCLSPSYEGMRVTAKENGQLMLPVWTTYASSLDTLWFK